MICWRLFCGDFVNNIVLSQFWAFVLTGHHQADRDICRDGLAVIFVMTMSAIVTWVVDLFFCNHLAWNTYGLLFYPGYCRFGPICGDGPEKTNPPFPGVGDLSAPYYHQLLHPWRSLLNVQSGHNIIETVVYSIARGWFYLAMIIMAGIRERLELVNMSEFLKERQ